MIVRLFRFSYIVVAVMWLPTYAKGQTQPPANTYQKAQPQQPATSTSSTGQYGSTSGPSSDSSSSSQQSEATPSTYKGPKDNGVNSSAKKANFAQTLGAIVSAGTGAYYLRKCGKHCWSCCTMAAMAFNQAAQAFSAAGGSARTDALSYSGDFGGFNSYEDYLDNLNGMTDQELLNQTNPDFVDDYSRYGVDANIAKLKNEGYVVKAESGMVETPDGDIPFDEVGKTDRADGGGGVDGVGGAGGSGGSGGGLPDGIAAGADKVAGKLIAKYKNKYKIHKIGLDTGGGGGGGRGRGYGDDDTGGSSGFSFNMGGRDKREPTSVAGLSRKSSTGEALGVAGDNLFEMVSRRYDKKKQQLNEAPGYVKYRRPNRR